MSKTPPAPPAFFHNRVIAVATFGDSTAAMLNPGAQTPDGGTTWDCDISQFKTNALPATGSLSAGLGFEKMTLPVYYPRAKCVYNGGITGQTTTQMLARDTAATAITRAAITDVINAAPDVILYRGGSINDVAALTASNTQADIDAIFTRHQQVVDRLMCGGAIVVDEGMQGYSATGVTDPDLTWRRGAMLQLNQRIKAAVAARGSRYKFLDLAGVTYDPVTGAYLANSSNDGVHLNTMRAMTLGKKEAALLTQLYGPSPPYRYEGANLATNPLFASVTSGVPAGVTWTNSSTTLANKAVVSRGGKQYAVCEATATAAGGTCGFKLDNLVYSGGGIAVSAGDKFGYECDVLMESLAGGAPPTPTTAWIFRVDLNGGGGGLGRFIASPFLPGTANLAAFEGPETWHIAWNQLVMPAASATFNNSTAWLLNWTLANIGDAIRIGVSSPRLVKQP